MNWNRRKDIRHHLLSWIKRGDIAVAADLQAHERLAAPRETELKISSFTPVQHSWEFCADGLNCRAYREGVFQHRRRENGIYLTGPDRDGLLEGIEEAHAYD